MAVTAAYVAAAAAVAGAVQNVGTANSAKRDAKNQASQAELGAIQREADRKDSLSASLASQNAAAGAGGIAALEGSPLTVMQEDIRQEEVATERDKFSSELEASAAISRGDATAQSLRAQSLIGLGSAAAGVSSATSAASATGAKANQPTVSGA